jgi:hypothetical protein
MSWWNSKQDPSLDTLGPMPMHLYQELDRTVRFYRRNGRLNKWLSLALASVAILTSFGIAIGGIIFDASGKVLGVVALLPAFVIFLNNVIQPHERAAWCFQKKDKLNALRRYLLYGCDHSAMDAALIAISTEWSRVDAEMHEQSRTALKINWAAFETKFPGASTTDSDRLKSN